MRLHLVDVFGVAPLSGNPLAVVFGADHLETEEMLRITRWLGFSETTFVSEPTTEDADYRVRIFTLAGELPFAGHPTLGTCHAWATEREIDADSFVQECGSGLVPLRRSEGRLGFRAPPVIRDEPVDGGFLSQLASVLGVDEDEIVDARWVDNGPGWVGLLFEDADAVLALEPDFRRYDGDGQLDIGVAGLARGEPWAYEVRAFFSDEAGRMREDPVTGSLNASLAQWLVGDGRVEPPYVARQGTRLGRDGRVHVESIDGEIWIGGSVSTIQRGLLEPLA